MNEICHIVLASRHEAKLAELRVSFSGLGLRFLSIAELAIADVASEEETTIEASARAKARAACRAAGLFALAEETGLEVAALGGRPGVRSARYAHERATDAENNAAVLSDLEDVDEEARGAQFRSVIVLASPWSDDDVIVEGRLEGRIARAPRGSGGFGYEPLFVVDGEGRVLAELGADEKREASPRVRAARLMRARLEAIVAELLADAERVAG